MQEHSAVLCGVPGCSGVDALHHEMRRNTKHFLPFLGIKIKLLQRSERHLSPTSFLSYHSIANISFHCQAEISFLPWTPTHTALSKLKYQYLHILHIDVLTHLSTLDHLLRDP